MTARPLVLVLALAAIVPSAALAQVTGDTTRLAPIVVTATRTPLATSELANGVTIIEGDALRRAGITTVAEALRGTTSLSLAQAGSYGAQTSVFLRGGESDYLRVLVDGVPLNQAGGFIDLANITTENVERIEIVRGPSSVLYGSDAMTGVVQIITRRGAGRVQVGAEARGGNYGTSGLGGSVAGGGERSAFSAGIQRDASSGIHPFNNDWANVGASGRLTLTPDARTDINLAARYRNGSYHYPTDGAGGVNDSNAQQASRQAAFSLDAGRRLSSSLELRALLGYVSGRDSTEDLPDSPGDTSGFYSESRSNTSRTTADIRALFRVGAPLLLTVGAVVDDEREKAYSTFTSAFFSGGDTSDVKRTNKAGYLQASGAAGRLSMQGGVRVDDNQRFGTFTTWRLGGALRVASATRLRANAGTAFKEPTFIENYNSAFSTGNPDLVPERSSSVEAGIEQGFGGGRATLTVTGFAQRFEDLIQYTFFTALPTDPNYYNVASARADGAEVELRVSASRSVAVSAQYTYLNTSTQDSGYGGLAFQPGQRLLRRPTHSGSLSAEWHAVSGQSVGARALYVGDRDDLDFSGVPARVALAAYGRLDLWGAWVVAHPTAGQVALTLRVDNVTDAAIEEVRGYQSPGRRVLAGVRFGPGR